MGNESDTFRLAMSVDGTGDWRLTLPVEATLADLHAVSPLIVEAQRFLAPTISPEAPPPCPLSA